MHNLLNLLDNKGSYQNTIKNKHELLVNIIKYFDDLLIKDYEKIDNSNSRDMIFIMNSTIYEQRRIFLHDCSKDTIFSATS